MLENKEQRVNDRELCQVKCTILDDSRATALQIEQRQARGGKLVVWIPRSQVEHISKRKGHMNTTLEIPLWLVESKGLDGD
jgi:hypothetical protein